MEGIGFYRRHRKKGAASGRKTARLAASPPAVIDLARNFRFYEKKRGHRRPARGWSAAAGEAVFFATFMVLGCVWLVRGFVLWSSFPESHVNHEFVERKCTVLEKKVVETRAPTPTKHLSPEIHIEYEINGRRL